MLLSTPEAVAETMRLRGPACRCLHPVGSGHGLYLQTHVEPSQQPVSHKSAKSHRNSVANSTWRNWVYNYGQSAAAYYERCQSEAHHICSCQIVLVTSTDPRDREWRLTHQAGLSTSRSQFTRAAIEICLRFGPLLLPSHLSGVSKDGARVLRLKKVALATHCINMCAALPCLSTKLGVEILSAHYRFVRLMHEVAAGPTFATGGSRKSCLS